MKISENVIAQSGLDPFFKVANAAELGLLAPELRKGDAVRTVVRSLSGFQKEALVTSARTGNTWRLVSDEGPYLNGQDAASCPLGFLTTGMIASYMNEITALAKQQNIEIRWLKLTQNNYYTMNGSMRDRTMVGGALPVELEVEIDCDLDDAALNQFLMNAVHASPLNGLMRGKLDSLFKLAKNGMELRTGKALEINGPILPDPDNNASEATAIPSDLALHQAIGMSPKKTVTKGTSEGGSSLTDHQDRTLNLGATCILREDGMKEIDMYLYSPHGTAFRFLSDEAVIDGGKGRAPDANSYISAGIGFCFMTQFGRFVSMMKLDLPEYSIVQDTHFSLGGGSGKTGKAGEADPVETHVFLETSESDSTAQEMLDMSEQTCFLHAFCRTDLKTKLKVVRV